MGKEREEFSQVVFRIACIFVIFFAGYGVHAARTWPYSLIRDGGDALVDLILNIKAYAAVEPTRHLYASPGPGDGVVRNETGKTAMGNVLLVGWFGNENAIKLISNDGREIHRWSPRLFEALPNMNHVAPAANRPPNEMHTLIHGVGAYPDGSLVLNFDLQGLVRIDKCGKPLWALPRMANHSISIAEDGTFWVPSTTYRPDPVAHLPLHDAPFYEDQLLHVSADGEILSEISLPKLLLQNDLEALLFPGGDTNVGFHYPDFMHINDAEVLTEEKARAFPQFAAGDIMLSMRQLNLVLVFNPKTKIVKWYSVGPWLRQHDPDFLPDGTISVFNNRSDNTLRGSVFKGSNILNIDPMTRKVTVAYEQPRTTKDTGFYTMFMGKHQHVDNGNILITQSSYGRAFEVDKDKRIVWEYINRYDDERVALISEATRLPESFFKVKDWSCSDQVASN